VTVLESLARLAYRVALIVCPRALRRGYTDEMRATFASLCRDAAARGAPAVLALVMRELWDLLRAAASARLAPHPAPPTFERRDSVGTVWLDLRYAWRLLRRQPGFTIVALLTLALGIGATTAVFTVVNGVLLRPLSYGHPDRIVSLSWGRPGRMSPWFSPLNFRDFTTQSQAFSDAAAYAPIDSNLTGLGDPERIHGAVVTWNFFHVLETPMSRGRAFVADEAKGPAPTVIILSDGLWRRFFGGRADAVGATAQIDGKPFTIVGIAPPGFKLPQTAEFWEPLIFSPRDLAPPARGAQWVRAVGRLAPGTGLLQTNSALLAVGARLAADYPMTNGGRTAALATPLQQQMVRNVRPTLLVLLGAVTCVLLISCVNVANLLLARAQARGREVAVRAALGAGRRRLVQQFLSESLLLGTIGGAAGLVVAYACLQALIALGPASIPRLAEVTIDRRVLAFTIAIAIGTSVVFGLAPALASTGGVLARFVANAGRGSVGGGTRTRKILVVTEMALAVVLLAGAGLLMRSYQQLQHVNPGFNPDHVLTASVSLPSAKYPQVSDDGRFTSALVDRLAATPGVSGAAVAFGLPFSVGFNASTSFRRRGEADSADSPSAGMRIVTPDYFRMLSIPLRAGRAFSAHDDATGPEVAIVNQEAARRFWPGADPLGEQIHVSVNLTSGERSGQKTIVGVVGDVKYGGLDAAAQPEIYLPYEQHRLDAYTVVLRTSEDPLSLAPALRREVAALDPELPVADVQPMTALIGSSIAERRFTMLLLAAFAAVALVLAAIGIYGVLAYVVGQRTQEIGVRLAIGAAPRDVVAMILREGMVLAATGLACGLAGALAATRALASLIFGVTTTDPITFAAVGVTLGGVALLASYVPARGAARVDPMAALRTD
jgi:putative ABC transport system permease protein